MLKQTHYLLTLLIITICFSFYIYSIFLKTITHEFYNFR